MAIARVKKNYRLPRGFRGSFYLSNTAGGIVISKRPPKRGPARSGAVFYREQEFGKAAYYAARPFPIDFETAVNLAKGTEMVPRDFLMMAAMGVLYEIEDTDGNEWKGWRMVQANAQFMLDQVTNEIGAMLFRAPIGWVELTPGLEGKFLRMGPSLTPAWQDAPALAYSGATIVQASDQVAQNYTTITNLTYDTVIDDQGGWADLAANNQRLTVPAGIAIAQAAVQVQINNLTDGLGCNAGIFLVNSSGVTKRRWFQNCISWGTTAINMLVTPPWPVVAGDRFHSSVQVQTDNSVTRTAIGSAFSAYGLA